MHRSTHWSRPAALTLLGCAAFGAWNAHNARVMAPAWGQDLAFFHQLIASAARGGPWASPLLLEPQGFLEMVHTHLVLPLLVGLYALWPRQELLLYAHAAFAALAIWPCWRLGEALGGRRMALAAVLGLVLLRPFQSAALADFRPSLLFTPGLIGLYAAAWRGSTRGMLPWALLAFVGREEAPYFFAAVGISLCLWPWPRLRLRQGLMLIGLGVAGLVFWAWIKPSFFFHFDPTSNAPPPELDPELVERRWGLMLRLLGSGLGLSLLQPTGILGALPSLKELWWHTREWERLEGPVAHYSTFWLGPVYASALAGLARLQRWLPATARPYLLALFVLSLALALPMERPRQGRPELRELADLVHPWERVAADYDTIHLFAGRPVLWNVEQLRMAAEDRPLAFEGAWPIPLDELDVLVLSADHPMVERAEGWRERGRVTEKVVLARP